jgi:hypothetical protein
LDQKTALRNGDLSEISGGYMEENAGCGRPVAMNLRREVSNGLVARGFRRQGRVHSLRVNEQFSLWVDTGPLNRRPDIAPFVGIRHEQVELLCAELLDLPSDEWTGTVGANVGYVLSGEYKWWQPPAQAVEVISAIEESLERLKLFLSLERLPEVWKIRGTNAPGWHYGLITSLSLAGRHADAMSQLDAAKAELCNNDDPVCEQFRGFEKRLRSRLSVYI